MLGVAEARSHMQILVRGYCFIKFASSSLACPRALGRSTWGLCAAETARGQHALLEGFSVFVIMFGGLARQSPLFSSMSCIALFDFSGGLGAAEIARGQHVPKVSDRVAQSSCIVEPPFG